MGFCIPDAPYIREAEQRGTDYMYDWVFGRPCEDEQEDEDEAY